MNNVRENENIPESDRNKKSYLSDVLGEMLGSKPTIEISGNNRMTVEGIRGILEYSKIQIRVSIGKMSLQIKGRGLNLKCISPTSIVVEGFILTVEYLI